MVDGLAQFHYTVWANTDTPELVIKSHGDGRFCLSSSCFFICDWFYFVVPTLIFVLLSLTLSKRMQDIYEGWLVSNNDYEPINTVVGALLSPIVV
jgi:hypothetical protein